MSIVISLAVISISSLTKVFHRQPTAWLLLVAVYKLLARMALQSEQRVAELQKLVAAMVLQVRQRQQLAL
jgi:hypothetical protein